MSRRLRLSVLSLVLVLLAGTSSRALAADFTGVDDFLSQYGAAAAPARPALAQEFVAWQQAHGGFPVVAPDGTVVFLYVASGKEREVRLLGDFRPRSALNVYWDDVGLPMTRSTPDGAVFTARLKFEQDARLDYAFLVDGQVRLDPLNARTLESGVAPGGKASELAMPGLRVAASSLPRTDVEHGELRVLDEPWATPKVTIYVPPSYDAKRRYPVVYTADGSAWRDLIRLPAVLDDLIAGRVIEPVIAVMIDAGPDRSAWYQLSPEYLAYLEKVVVWVDAHYATRANAEGRLHMGTSAGGRASLYVGFERPSLFHKLALLSPSLVGPPSYYAPYFSGRKRPDRRLSIWLSAGTYEPYIHQDTQVMASYFAKLRLRTKVVYTHEGHSFGAWRRLTPDVLRYFFPLRRP